MKNNKRAISLGIEQLLTEKTDILKDLRIGVVCNQSSVNHLLRYSADLLWENESADVRAFFGPQHGIRGEVQDNMIETSHCVDRKTGLPVYSLYSETREPTEEMVKDIDAFVFDIQDVGCRVYTFIYTLANVMRSASKFNKKVIVCDRPNPINGINIEGNLLEEEFVSFVGQFPIPLRHGMTVGELGYMYRDLFGINCELEIVKMEGWSRELWFDETDAPWVIPSPNMPTVETSVVFPATVMLEGTMLSEGRGTTRPFEIIGAPYIKSQEFVDYLKGLKLNGVYFRECGFEPTFQKHARVHCEGVQIHVTDRKEFEPVKTGVAIVKAAFDLYGDMFKWKEPPYEYVFHLLPFDVIMGTEKIRNGVEKGSGFKEITEGWKADEDSFSTEREPFLLY